MTQPFGAATPEVERLLAEVGQLSEDGTTLISFAWMEAWKDNQPICAELSRRAAVAGLGAFPWRRWRLACYERGAWGFRSPGRNDVMTTPSLSQSAHSRAAADQVLSLARVMIRQARILKDAGRVSLARELAERARALDLLGWSYLAA